VGSSPIEVAGSREVRKSRRRPCFPGSSNGRTAGSEPVRVGSTPAPGTDCPGGETDIMAPSEGAGPGSIPGRGTDGHPRGVAEAHDPAKVEGEVRLLTRILWLNPSWCRDPAVNRERVGSTPIGHTNKQSCRPDRSPVGPAHGQGCAPGRAVRLQPARRGFESFRPCCQVIP
jgi:hypothetical protein